MFGTFAKRVEHEGVCLQARFVEAERRRRKKYGEGQERRQARKYKRKLILGKVANMQGA